MIKQTLILYFLTFFLYSCGAVEQNEAHNSSMMHSQSFHTQAAH